MATTERDNEDHARRFNEAVWGRYDFEAIDDLVAEDFVGYDPALPESVRGPDGVREVAETLHAAFPDREVDPERIVAGGDWLAQRLTATGTHEGGFTGIEPTGNRAEFGDPVVEDARAALEDGAAGHRRPHLLSGHGCRTAARG